MMRLIAYPFVVAISFGALVALYLGIDDLLAGDIKGGLSCFAFVAFWSWAVVSMYTHHIKRPREEKRKRCAEAAQVLAGAIIPDSSLSTAIEEVRGRFSLVGEPRHRSSPDSSFDTMVELETQAFIVSLFGRDGVIKSWSVR